MNAASGKQEPVFDLIRSMSKAEKRNFKLYATRLSGNQEAKFVTLFDCMDSLDEYDEAKILQRCPIKKEQLPNMKAHLYKQILVSIRLLDVQRTVPMQLREQIDFARILYDKGLFRQSSKMLDKAKETALANEQYTAAIDIIDFRKKMDTLSVARGVMSKSEAASRQAIELVRPDRERQRAVERRGAALRPVPSAGLCPDAEGPGHDRAVLRPETRQVRRSLEAVVSRAALPVSGAGMVSLYPARYADVLQVCLSLDRALRPRAPDEAADVRYLPQGLFASARRPFPDAQLPGVSSRRWRRSRTSTRRSAV